MGGTSSTLSSTSNDKILVAGYVNDFMDELVTKTVENEVQKKAFKTQYSNEEKGVDDLLASYLSTTSHGQSQLGELRNLMDSKRNQGEKQTIESILIGVEKDVFILLAMKHYPEFISSSIYQDWMLKRAETKLKSEEDTNKTDDMASLMADADGEALFMQYLQSHHGLGGEVMEEQPSESPSHTVLMGIKDSSSSKSQYTRKPETLKDSKDLLTTVDDMNNDDPEGQALLASYLETTSHGQKEMEELRAAMEKNKQNKAGITDLRASFNAVEKDMFILLAMKHYPEFISSRIYQDWILKRAETKMKSEEESETVEEGIETLMADVDGKALFMQYLQQNYNINSVSI